MRACCPLPAPRCCHAHDCCYQKLFDLGCRPYVDHYEYTIENNTSIVCSEFLPCRSSLPHPGEGLRLPVPRPPGLLWGRPRGCRVKYGMPTYV